MKWTAIIAGAGEVLKLESQLNDATELSEQMLAIKIVGRVTIRIVKIMKQ